MWKSTLKIALGILLTLAIFNGLQDSWSGESLGWNLYTILAPIAGLYLIYSGYKDTKKTND